MSSSWVALFLCVLLVGCTQPAASPEGPGGVGSPEALGPLAFSVRHDGCRGVELFAPTTAEAARPFVPEAFALTDPALAVVGAYVCGDDDRLAGRGFVAIQVTPEADLASPSATNHFWEPEHYLVDATEVTDAYRAARATYTQAQVDVTVSATGTSFTIESANATYTFTGTTTAAPGTSGTVTAALPAFREYAAGDGGYVYLDAGFGGGDGLAGTATGMLTITGDGAGAALFGASSQRSGPAVTAYEYTDAVVGFIPRS